jgi:hypothetical protein
MTPDELADIASRRNLTANESDEIVIMLRRLATTEAELDAAKTLYVDTIMECKAVEAALATAEADADKAYQEGYEAAQYLARVARRSEP